MGNNPLKRDREAANSDSPHVSSTPSKRQRKSKADDLKLAKIYNDLSAESEQIRLTAAKEFLQWFSAENAEEPQAVEKALNRLIKGLCSQRKAARFGFFITLTEFLRQLLAKSHPAAQELNLKVHGVIGLVDTKTQPQGNFSGQERRDHLIGKLFGYKAIIQSTVLLQPAVLHECWNTVIQRVCTMARDIPWLREECGLILYEAICNPDSKPPAELAERVLEHLSSSKLVNTPEGVAVWLAIRNTFSDAVLPQSVWHEKDPLSKKERSRLAKILKEDFRSISDKEHPENIKNAAANPNPVFAWDVVFTEILRRDADATKKIEFPPFWIDAVDSNLFAASSSHERKSWGFKIFSKMILGIPKAALPSIFSPNLTRSLINQSKGEDRFLHAAALAALKAIKTRAQTDPQSAADVFIALSSGHGTIEFDKLSKSKTLESIASAASDEALRMIVDHLRAVILRPGTEEAASAEARRRVVADLLLHIVRSYSHYETAPNLVGKESSWLNKLLDTFVENAYFVPTRSAKTKKAPLPPISEATRKIFQERLSSCLGRLLPVGKEIEVSFPSLVVSIIQHQAEDSKDLELVFKADETVLKTVKTAHKSLKKLTVKASRSSKNATAQGFVLLYSLSLIQVYDGDGDAVLMLEELEACRKSASKKKDSDDNEGQDGFVEILLTFLGNPRALFLKVAEQAFEVFAPDVTPSGLHSLLDVLETEENLDGQKALFQQDGDDEEVEDGSDDDDLVEASDVEMVDDESAGSDADSDSDSADEDHDSEEGSDEEEDEELTNFNTLLAETLKTSGFAAGDSDDDEDMDDDQMLALDSQLAKIFKERTRIASKKKERESAKQTVVQFKSRVLELLSIYVEKARSNLITLDVVIPLLRRIRPNFNKQVADKSYKVLKNYIGAKKEPLPVPDKDEEEAVWELLKSIHEEAKLGGGSGLHANACSSASIFIVKVLVSLDKANYAKAVDVYAASQKEWFSDPKSLVQPGLFTEFQNWSIQAWKQAK